MKNKKYILIILILLAAELCSAAYAEESVQTRERKIKAAFLYNFINFVQWPEEVSGDDDEPFVIGIVGKTIMNREFLKLASKNINNKRIVVKQYENFCDSAKKLKNSKSKEKWMQDIELLKKCHVVFISNCKSISDEDASLVLNELKGIPVLTVGETEGLLEKGCIINFITGNKVRFEINLKSANANSVKIRSKLIKLAKRIIREEEKESME